MTDYAAIAIGINQYRYDQFFQPLSYAVQDAEALYDFLINQAGFAIESSCLLTDRSPSSGGYPTYPTQENISKCMERMSQKPKLKMIWFFFSGYSYNYDGQDYLLPIDTDPHKIKQTGIAVRSILLNLSLVADSVLVILDIKRSQLAQGSGKVGQQTAELAHNLSIPTILSCQPHQNSYETHQLRHSFFTATLLEGLRQHKYSTIQSLEQFLQERLPQLCEHHVKPKQEPVIVIGPSVDHHWEIFPSTDREINYLLEIRNGGVTKMTNNHSHNHQTKSLSNHRLVKDDLLGNSSLKLGDLSQSSGANVMTSKSDTNGTGSPNPNSDLSETNFLQRLLIWSGAIAMILLCGVFITNRDLFLAKKSNPPRNVAAPTTPNNANTNNPKDSQITNNNQVDQPKKPLVLPQPQRQPLGQPVNNLPNNVSSLIFEQAKVVVSSNSASALNEAIALVRKIPKTAPEYQDAQFSIQRWSDMIMDIAEGRALKDNFGGALAAAKLVPDANLEVYQDAQDAIADWNKSLQMLKANQGKLQEASKQIKPGQASTYSKAIERASIISENQPGFVQAQKAIESWSEEIWKIALARANRGQLAEAIAAATLVPNGTKSYQTAQKSIDLWQARIKRQSK